MQTKLIVGLTFALATTGLYGDNRDTNGDGAVQVLVPIAFSASQTVHGANGSIWRGEFWVQNSATEAIQSLQPTGICAPPCPDALPPGWLGKYPSLESNNNDGGALLQLPADVAEGVHFSNRLLETSRRAQPTGVDLPVIREREFLSAPTTLLGIPTGSGIRSMLRVYDPRAQRGSTVRVELLDGTGAVIAATELRPGDHPSVPAQWNPYQQTPGYAAIADLTSVFPEAQSMAEFHVRLTPLTPGMEYWGFISVTDNESQHVLLVTPH